MTGTASELVLRAVREGLLLALLVSGPPLLASVLVGFLVGVVQAATQVQDQTLAFVPKIIAIFLTMLIALPFMGATMSGYMTRLADMIVTGG